MGSHDFGNANAGEANAAAGPETAGAEAAGAEHTSGVHLNVDSTSVNTGEGSDIAGEKNVNAVQVNARAVEEGTNIQGPEMSDDGAVVSAGEGGASGGSAGVAVDGVAVNVPDAGAEMAVVAEPMATPATATTPATGATPTEEAEGKDAAKLTDAAATASEGVDGVAQPQLLIDPQFRDLVPPPTPLERWLLEASLAREGCREALVVWKETGILLDGHNRFEICRRRGFAFRVVLLSFPDRDSALAWVARNQLGRRNLKPLHVTLLIGRLYNREKRQGRRTDREALNGQVAFLEEVAGGTEGNRQMDGEAAGKGAWTGPTSDVAGGTGDVGEAGTGDGTRQKASREETCGNASHKSTGGRTAPRLANQYGIDEKTVRNAGAFARNLEKLKSICPELERNVVIGTAPSIRTINRAARLVERNPEMAAAILRGEVLPTGAEGAGDEEQGSDEQEGDEQPGENGGVVHPAPESGGAETAGGDAGAGIDKVCGENLEGRAEARDGNSDAPDGNFEVRDGNPDARDKIADASVNDPDPNVSFGGASAEIVEASAQGLICGRREAGPGAAPSPAGMTVAGTAGSTATSATNAGAATTAAAAVELAVGLIERLGSQANVGLHAAGWALVPAELAVRCFVASVNAIVQLEDPTKVFSPERAESFAQAMERLAAWQAARRGPAQAAAASGDATSLATEEPLAAQKPQPPRKWWQSQDPAR